MTSETESRAQKLIIRVLGNLQRLYAENYALKTMLSPDGNWKAHDLDAQIREILQRPESEPFLERINSAFSWLRPLVLDAFDEEAGFRVLLERPTRGKPS